MDHPDFRVRNKVFASLSERDGEHWGMVKLTPAAQKQFIRSGPGVFSPASGAWGASGATMLCLAAIKPAQRFAVREALKAAWQNTAPKSLLAELDTKDA